MKVMHIASGDLWAGAEKQLYTLLCALRDTGRVQVVVVLLNRGTLEKKIRAEDIDLLALDESRQNALQLAIEIHQFIKLQKPDVIHTHRTKENILGSLLALIHKTPCLRTQHGSSEFYGSPASLRNTILRNSDYLLGRYVQKRIVAVSDPLGEEMAAQFTSRRVTVIDNGLDLESQSMEASSAFKDPLEVGFVGRLVPVKRVDLFLQVAHAVRSFKDIPQPIFSVIGDGPLLNTLKEQARELNLMHDITFVGHVDNAEKQMSRLDVLVICSDHEGLPMVSLEALKHRTLVLTHPIGGLPKLLGHGDFGLIVKSQSADEFANALRDIIQHKEDLPQLTERAYGQLEKHYSSSNMAEKYLQLYLTLSGELKK